MLGWPRKPAAGPAPAPRRIATFDFSRPLLRDRRLPRRLPLTIGLVAGIVLATVLTHTVRHELPAELLARWGFGAQDLRAGELWRLATAPWFVLRPTMFVAVLALILFFVGAAELLQGTRRALAAAVAGHVVAYTITPVLLGLLARAGVAGAAALAAPRDVGASHLAFGAAGLAVAGLPTVLRRRLLVVFAIGLLLALVLGGHNWDVAHAIAFPTGALVGTWLPRRRDELPPAVHRGPERHQLPTMVALVVAAAGLLDLVSAAVRNPTAPLERLETWLAVTAGQPPRMLVLMSGVLLLVLAPAIGRRRRAAWGIAVAVQLVSFALHLPAAAYRLEAALALLLLALLLAMAPLFSAPSDVRGLRRGRLLLLGGLAGLPLLGALAMRLLRGGFAGPYDFDAALREAAARLVFASHHVLVPVSPAARALMLALPVVGWLVLIAAVAMVVRGVSPRPRTLNDEEAARRLVEEYGDSSTAYMTLWPGNALAFGADRAGFAAYRVKADVAVVLGDPIGPPAAREAMIQAVADLAAARGWEHIFYATTAGTAPLYRAAGYDLLQIGEEAVIPLEGLSFTGKKWQNVRTALNRAAREGVTFQFWEGGSIPPDVRAQFDRISAEWESGRALPAMEFTLGRTSDVDDPEVYVAAAVGADGRVHAFIDWLPVPARQGWVIDLMRRREDALTGVMEYLIGMSLLALQERGYRQASLATAPLADLDRDGAASPLQRLLDLVYRRFDAFYNFQSLFEFKARFQPRWEPIYLAYRGEEALLRATGAIAAAHLPDLNAASLARLVGRAVAARVPPA